MSRLQSFFTGLGISVMLLFLSPFAYAQQSDATLELRPSQTQAQNADEFYVDVYLQNPSAQNIISIRSWLQYNPGDLEVLSIDRLTSPFSLAAPGENAASASEKLIKMGYSNIEGGSTATEAEISRINFKVKTTQAKQTTLSFYDYQVSELGHTNVNVMSQGFPVNILAQKPDSVSITLNGGSVPPVEMGGNNEQVTSPSSTGPLPEPLNLKADTRSGEAHLKWKALNEKGMTGYYLYYGKTPGLYTRRKTLGRVSEFIVDDLRNGETYYFAITAYNSAGDEGNYSNEVGIIVGEPLSSTHPFQTIEVNEILAQVPVQTESGPALNGLLISVLGLGVVLGLGRRRKKV